MPIAVVFWKQLKVATMMSNKFRNMKVLGLLVLLFFTQGCAQKLGRFRIQQGRDSGLIQLEPLSEIYGATTLMATDNYLFATGAGSGFGAWDFASGSFNSNLTQLAGSPLAPFFLTNNTANVLSMVEAGGSLFVSSQPGLYQINISNVSLPTMTRALPYSVPGLATYTPYSTVANFGEEAKEQFRFDSMVYVPNQNQIWGFRGNKMSRLNLNDLNRSPQGQTLSINTSCGKGDKQSSAYFQGKVYVAACSQVLVLDPNSGAVIGNFPYRINAVQVVATRNRLYIHHQPVTSWGQYTSSAQPGLYVFDTNMSYVNYIGIEPISFAVSPDDQIIYANEDNSEIIPYQIP